MNDGGINVQLFADKMKNVEKSADAKKKIELFSLFFWRAREKRNKIK
jgi:hypothetical protein